MGAAWRAAVDDPTRCRPRAASGAPPAASYRYFIARAAPLLDESGRTREWVGHIVDVHDTMTAEMELRRRDEQIRAILDHSPTFIFLKDLSGRYLLAGRQCQAVLGVPARTSWARPTTTCCRSRWPTAGARPSARCCETGRRSRSRRSCSTGEVNTFLTSLFPAAGRPGRAPTPSRGISTDITERKRAAEEAQQAVERRDRFLAMLSHELRTPLGAIVNATEILHRYQMGTPSTNAAEVIGRQARHMGRLIDDLLDVGRITRDQIVMDARLVDLGEALAEAVEAIRPEAERKGLTLSLRRPDEPDPGAGRSGPAAPDREQPAGQRHHPHRARAASRSSPTRPASLARIR